MEYVLKAIVRSLEESSLARVPSSEVTWDPYPQDNPSREAHLTQDYLWPVRAEHIA
jgi:hypothetical protein